MLDVTEIWRKYHIQRPLEISGDVVNWYKDIWENGLCGGWANFHKYEPELLTQIWLLLEKWEPDFGLSTKEALIQFNEYVEKYSYGLVYPKDGWAPLVTSILKNSFKWMKDYENKEYLSEPPELKTPVTYEFKTKRYVKKYKVTVGKKNAGIEIMKLILSDSNVKSKECVTQVGTEKHYMSIRTYPIAGKIKIKEIVESERLGIYQNLDLSGAYSMINEGVYLGEKVEGNVDVEIFLK